MIRDQLMARGIRDPRVLDVLAELPRERFIDPDLEAVAYADRALPIDCGQTISQPYIVALMTEALRLTGNERALEIGTGSAYQAAVLSRLAREVVSIERHEKLFRQATRVLNDLGVTNVRLVLGDGSHGLAAGAPYDRIIVTAAADTMPEELFEQLTAGGILVIPVGDRDSQILRRIEKIDGRPRITDLTACRFVPLVGASTCDTNQ